MDNDTDLTLDKTGDIACSIAEMLKEKVDVVQCLTNNDKARELLLTELFQNAYIRGFFAGMKHAMRDEVLGRTAKD